MTHVLAVGTRKGLWLFRSEDRRTWTSDGPHFLMQEVASVAIELSAELSVDADASPVDAAAAAATAAATSARRTRIRIDAVDASCAMA